MIDTGSVMGSSEGILMVVVASTRRHSLWRLRRNIEISDLAYLNPPHQSKTLAFLIARVKIRGVSASQEAESGLATTYGVVSRMEWDYPLHLKAAPTLTKACKFLNGSA